MKTAFYNNLKKTNKMIQNGMYLIIMKAIQIKRVIWIKYKRREMRVLIIKINLQGTLTKFLKSAITKDIGQI
jgi:hypothetical protein